MLLQVVSAIAKSVAVDESLHKYLCMPIDWDCLMDSGMCILAMEGPLNYIKPRCIILPCLGLQASNDDWGLLTSATGGR